jgi:hypothetical protein
MSLPVFQAEVRGTQLSTIPTALIGTCFALGGDYMITAGHVAATTHDVANRMLVVGVYDSNTTDIYDSNTTDIYTLRVVQVEQLPCDLALLQVEFILPEMSRWYHRFRWSAAPLNPFTPVRTVGYAYGVQHVGERVFTIVRGFEGYIVSQLNEFAPVGYSGTPFEVSELSFAAPRGLSGSPLFLSAGTVTVHGLIIGNSQSRMTVFREEEQVKSEDTRTIVERYEMLTLGIAVPASEIIAQRSQLLGGTVLDHLNQHELMT